MSDTDYKQIIDEYLEKSGQSFSDLMSGASTYGFEFIRSKLVPEALQQGKKIVWLPDPVEGEDVGLVKYELQDL